MNRDEWVVLLSRQEVLTAATVKQDWHNERLKFWTDKQNEVMELIKAEGLTIEDSVAAGYSSQNVRRGPEVCIRTDLSRDLAECRDKIREHTDKLGEFHSWVEFLAANGNQELSLTMRDYLFFFGK